MILLPSNSTDFKSFASTVVDEHENSGKSIEDCLVEASEKRKLTPEEIKRLVEKTNTELSLRHLRGDNKKDSFALASSTNVIKRTHGDTENKEASVEKTASLPTTRSYNYGDWSLPTVGTMKVAEQHIVSSSEVFQLKKEYEAAKLEKMALEVRLQDNLDWLVKSLQKREAPDFGKFASEAISLYGNTAQLVMVHLANALGKQNIAKVAECAVVDDTSDYMNKVKQVCEDTSALLKQSQLVDQLGQLVDTTKKAIQKAVSC